MWNHCLFILHTEFFQIQEPFIAAFHAGIFIFRIQFYNTVNTWVPVFIHQLCKQLLHSHLGHAVHIQLRQHARYIIQQNAVAANNIKVLRAKHCFVIIKNIRNPVHRHCRLAGTCHALDNHIRSRRLADNLILFFLYRSNNFPKHSFFIFRQILGQQLIVCYNVRIIKILQPVRLDFIRTLPL